MKRSYFRQPIAAILAAVLCLFSLPPSTALAQRSVTISWNASTNPFLKNYNVYYKETGSGSEEIKITVPLEGLNDPEHPELTIDGLDDYTSYTFTVKELLDTGLEADTEYCYRVRAVNDAGPSDYSNHVCISTPATPTGPGDPLYTLTITETGSGIVSKNPNFAKYRLDEQVLITTLPSPGWSFLRWTGDATGTSPQISLAMSSNTTVTAEFESTIDDFVGYWSFDDGTAEDQSLNGNDGILSGAEVSDIHGVRAMTLDEWGDHLEFPDSASLSFPGNQLTLACWMNPSHFLNNRVTIMQRSRPGGESSPAWYDWQLYARADDAPTAYHPVFRIELDGDSEIDTNEQVEADVILIPRNWYFVVATYDGTNLKIYIDGILRGTTNAAGGTIPNSGESIWVGGNSVWDEYFNGIIDEVRIYDRALSASEVQALMFAGPVPGPPFPPFSPAVTPVSPSQVSLAWTDTSRNEAYFEIERKRTIGGIYGKLATLGMNEEQFEDTQVQNESIILSQLIIPAMQPESLISTPFDGERLNSLSAITGSTASGDLDAQAVYLQITDGTQYLHSTPPNYTHTWEPTPFWIEIPITGDPEWSYNVADVFNPVQIQTDTLFTVRSYASDGMGHDQSIPDEVSFFLDVTAPTGTVTYNGDPSRIRTGRLMITVEFDEGLGNAPRISISSSGPLDVDSVPMTGVGTHWNYPVDIPPGDNSTYDVLIFGISDLAGNTRADLSSSFTTESVDTDGDGLPDSWELANGTDPNVSGGIHGKTGDIDGDGSSNFEEYANETAQYSTFEYPGYSPMDLTLEWAYWEDATIYGFRIYYQSGSVPGDYNGVGADQGPSPIEILPAELDNPGNLLNPQFTITGLDNNEIYRFVVTAWVNGDESTFSNQAVYDKTLPQSEILYPTNDQFLNSLPTISGSSQPSDLSIITGIEIQVTDGSQYLSNAGSWIDTPAWFVPSDTANPASWSHDTASISFQQGAYNVRSRATDSAPKAEILPDEIRFTYDNVSPVGTIYFNGAITDHVSESQLFIAATFSEPLLETAGETPKIQILGGGPLDTGSPVNMSGSGNHWMYEVDIPVGDNTRYTVTVSNGVDLAGNAAEILSGTVTTGAIDTDDDRIPDFRDDDDDNDGLPDSEEAVYGLDPLIDDTIADTDVDGYPNLTELIAGTSITNRGPDTPLLIPLDNPSELIPELTAGTYSDFEGDAHIKSIWQISTDETFSDDGQLVFHLETDKFLEGLPVPDLVLNPDSTAFSRVLFIDSNNGPSLWSAASAIITGQDDEDVDGDGVPDTQSVLDDTVDLTGDGQNDQFSNTYKAVYTTDPAEDNIIGVECITAGCLLERLTAKSPDYILDPENRPLALPFGLIGFRLSGLPVGGQAEVLIRPLVLFEFEEYELAWFAYDLDIGWQDFADNSTTHPDGTVTIILVDGGPGDGDGVANGVIVILSGPGVPQNCFIATAAFGSPMERNVRYLSDFRDRYLFNNALGKSSVAFYYRYSPALADYINTNPFIKKLVSLALLPIAWVAYTSVQYGGGLILFLTAFCFVTVICARITCRLRNR